MYEPEHGAYAQLEGIGREIAKEVKPAAVLVVSAHWEAAEEEEGGKGDGDRDVVEVNFGEEEGLVYE